MNELQQLLVPVPSLEAYMATVNGIPMLSAQAEYELASRLQQQGDLSAARALVLSHLRFVVRVAKEYNGYGLALADLIQEGNIGLMKAVKRFDPTVGVRLVSFAVHWIKSEIHEYIIKNWRIVKIATTKAQRKLFFNLRKMKPRLGWFSEAEIQDVAKELNVPVREVIAMEMRLNAQDAAFDGHQDTAEDENPYIPALYLEDKGANPALLIEQDNWQIDATDRLQHAFEQLDERSQIIIRTRWLNDNKATLQELAERFQISAERVRQLEQKALDNLKTLCGDNHR